MSDFPRDFVWGAATSSYQIEGAAWEDGRGACIWDTFCRTEGKVHQADNGDVACDHYHRYHDDVALMKRLGLQAYRFSIAWPRILPTGLETEPNQAGLAFYDRLVDALLEAGITPWATLYHWDLPQPLEDRGGWPSRDILPHFERYADIVTRRLGDRVKHWITHNEPWCAAILGYQTGLHAPGRTDPGAALAAAHHILLSHGRTVPIIRENSPGSKVGITLNLSPAEPASPSEADRIATQRFDGHFNRWFLEPVHGRGYPADQVAFYAEEGFIDAEPAFVQPGDLDTIAVDTDFLGINYYSRAIIRSDRVPEQDNAPRSIPVPGPDAVTDIGWEVCPDGLYRLLKHLQAEYGGPIVITENGAAYHTGPSDDGAVHDAKRVAYLKGHLEACERAIREGVDLAGYFAWSLMDNFEWHDGYRQRFGIVYVDYPTQTRIPKDSALWFADRIATASGSTP